MRNMRNRQHRGLSPMAVIKIKQKLGELRMARRRKRTSLIEDFLEMFLELTDMFWQIGAVITVIFFVGGLDTLIDAMNYQPIKGTLLAALNQLQWIHYLIPTVLFVLSFIFGTKTYSAYQRQNIIIK